MFEGVDTIVLHNELALHDELPVSWEPATGRFDTFTLHGMDEANISLLLACIAVEEQPLRDKNEELTPLAHELARLDYKINLALQLLGRLVSDNKPVEARSIRFNALGAEWQMPAPQPQVGAQGTLSVRLRGSLPQMLNFAAEITSADGFEVSARYLHLSELSAELIQKLAFLRHRKEVADKRKSRA